jgi:hypothetical protein
MNIARANVPLSDLAAQRLADELRPALVAPRPSRP